MDIFRTMPRGRLEQILQNMRSARVAMLGDLCLDVYWLADMRRSELSRETPHFPLPVVEERLSPGAGGNVAANLAALKPARTWALGVLGQDWRGAELTRLLETAGIDMSHIVRVPDIVTNAYCKPLRSGLSKVIYEDPRLDFNNYKPLSDSAQDALIASLDAVATQVDILCVSDQFAYGAVTERVREKLMRLARDGLTVMVDSRDRIGLYRDVLLKPNEVEGARAAGLPDAVSLEDFAEAALKLSAARGCEVLMTVGPNGSLYTAGGHLTHITARDIPGPIDIVGAGDTFLAGFSMALAAGASRPEAALVAGLCSEVTIQQIGATGVATPEQVLEWYERCGAGDC